MRRAAGFTLLEVLVALAVLAIAMGAIISAATQSIANTAALRDQTLAGWVALNQVSERLLDPEPWPEEGLRDGRVELANRVWRWRIRFAKTDDADLRRIDVTVRAAASDAILSALTAFKAHPPSEEPANPPTDSSSATPSSRSGERKQ